MYNILIVDDEPDFCESLSNLLQENGYKTICVFAGKKAISIIEKEPVDLVLLDLNLPGMDGIQVLERIKTMEETLPVIVLTGYGEIKSAVESMKKGAYNYLVKPFDDEELLINIKKAIETKKLGHEVKILKERLKKHEEKIEFISKSKRMNEIFHLINQVAPTEMTVIIQGASGTGKEVIARYIHEQSSRKQGPFITVDCGTLPENLVESELFGYEKGAFTGADNTKPGQFELAESGILFLDEIGNLPLSTQSKFLRVLQERKVQHLGGKKEISIDVRIITATNVNLNELVKKGLFREDLYYRLNEFTINLPLLTERKEDISVLAEHFLKEAVFELRKKVKEISPEAMKILEKYHWSGNIRELKNTIKRAVLLAEDVIFPEHIKLTGISMQENNSVKRISTKKETLKRILDKTEKDLIMKALVKTKYHKIKAAKLLDIDRTVLSEKIRKYKLDSCHSDPDLPGGESRDSSPSFRMTKKGLKEAVETVEKQKIIEILKETNNDKTKASRLLGITRTDIYYKMKKYGI